MRDCHGGIFGDFYLSLLNPPDPEYLDDVAAFLSLGEIAPFKDASRIDELTPRERNFWVSKLSATYQKQREEYERSRSRRR
jgi:hypothetical protein